MKVMPRTEFGNPILRTKAKNVSPKEIKTKKFQDLIKLMIFTMRRSGGVGLAAPQIGKGIRLAVMEIKPTKTRPNLKIRRPIAVINPHIVKYSKNKIADWEGCLSLNNVRGKVPRSSSIVVEYINEEGKKVTEKASGLWARIFQHEIDHLNGVVYVDRMKGMTTMMSVGEFKKRVLKMK